MITKRLFRCLIIVWLGSTSLAWSGPISDFILEESQAIMTELNEKRDFYQTDPQALNQYLNSKIDDLFHFRYMGQFAAGKYWRQMSDKQQQEYLQEFQNFLINSYGQSLLDIHSIDFMVQEEVPSRHKNRYWVTMVVNFDGQKYTFDYEIADTKKGLKIINIKAENISLIVNYRQSFGDIFAQQGVAELISLLKRKNQEIGS